MPATPQSVQALIEQLTNAMNGGAFYPFIDFIQFPKYRSLAPNERIDFSFPLTVLVGQNGTGKTSVLQALYGAPERMTVAKYWFSTAVDPIDNDGGEALEPDKKQKFQGERSAFWYGYRFRKPDGTYENREPVKMRIWRKDKPDYWEPSRPIQNYGMTLLPGKERWPQIDMPSTYLSLRYNLNAFDRCFHFPTEATLARFRYWWQKKGNEGRPTIQDYLRSRSRRLKSAIEKRAPTWSGVTLMNNAPKRLTTESLDWISRIIGKRYKTGTTIDHKFYETHGRSVILSTESHSYSEAFAGSGESLVVNLVTEVLAAKPNSLLLLDEPETSLHPGAQRALLGFLLEQSLHNKLQVVVSTHSSELVRDLPTEAIRVFRGGQDGKVHVEHSYSASEAFHVIGFRTPPRCHLLTEDKLSEELLSAAIKDQGESFQSQFLVEYRPGGASGMFSEIAHWSASTNSRPYFVFDGDQRPSSGMCSPGDLKRSQLVPTTLDGIIKRQCGNAVKLRLDSNMSPEAKVDVRLQYLNYCVERVRFLPFSTPEEAIWNADACRSLLETLHGSADVADGKLKQIEVLPIKERYAAIADPSAMTVDNVHRIFITRFREGKPPAWNDLVALVKGIAGE